MTAVGHRSIDRLTPDLALSLATAAGVSLLIAIGFVTSYETLRQLAISEGGFTPWLAPTIPLSFDLGIVVLSLKIVGAARQGRRVLVHRALVTVLSTATVAVNSAAATGTAGRLLHAVPPAMFVICFEGLTAEARRQATSARRTSYRAWTAALLAPISTMRRWRDDALAAGTAAPRPAKHPTAQRRPPRSTRSSTAMATPTEPRSPSGSDARLEIVRDALRHQPRLSAPEITRVLRERGHDVSVRTAQRLKARTTVQQRQPARG